MLTFRGSIGRCPVHCTLSSVSQRNLWLSVRGTCSESGTREGLTARATNPQTHRGGGQRHDPCEGAPPPLSTTRLCRSRAFRRWEGLILAYACTVLLTRGLSVVAAVLGGYSLMTMFYILQAGLFPCSAHSQFKEDSIPENGIFFFLMHTVKEKKYNYRSSWFFRAFSCFFVCFSPQK